MVSKFTPSMDIIKKYFPQLTPLQIQQFEKLQPLYRDWNQKINVISRKDIDNLYERHVLHSLAIAKIYPFLPGAEILDLGTGGGFPGIPLAIFFPETQFTLIDGTGKKIRVVNEISAALELKNVKAKQIRAEELKQHFDFVLSRAVTQLDQLITWSFRLLKKKQQHATPNGLISLKGGNVHAEIKTLPRKEYVEAEPISNFFEEDYFKEKFVVYVQG
jgi:16S rRNA (guanine527-N7)-methyltransferase